MTEEQIAELQYEAGMYQSLYENAAKEIKQLRRDIDHAKAVKEVWMNRALRAEAGRGGGQPEKSCS